MRIILLLLALLTLGAADFEAERAAALAKVEQVNRDLWPRLMRDGMPDLAPTSEEVRAMNTWAAGIRKRIAMTQAERARNGGDSIPAEGFLIRPPGRFQAYAAARELADPALAWMRTAAVKLDAAVAQLK
jgi:hypothetical protein